MPRPCPSGPKAKSIGGVPNLVGDRSTWLGTYRYKLSGPLQVIVLQIRGFGLTGLGKRAAINIFVSSFPSHTYREGIWRYTLSSKRVIHCLFIFSECCVEGCSFGVLLNFPTIDGIGRSRQSFSHTLTLTFHNHDHCGPISSGMSLAANGQAPVSGSDTYQPSLCTTRWFSIWSPLFTFPRANSM